MELDDRLPLKGDIDLLDSFIGNISGSAEKYLHITLAFKEDHLDEAMYRMIIDRFEEFAFSAYRKNEYMLYAEAHLPRIKSFLNKATGKIIERKPHIHIIIPKLNLLSGASLNPFGMLYKSSRFIDVFQETINAELGLASPKDNRRVRIEGRADLLARHDGHIPFETGKSLKESILAVIIRRNISSIEELERALGSYGTVRRRNPSHAAMYFNVKPEDSPKGFNLKEYVFSEQFLKLPLHEKRRRISNDEPRYIDRAFGIEQNPELSTRLTEWRSLVSLELKYINSGNRNEYKRYLGMSDGEKSSYLSTKAERFYQRHIPETQPSISALPLNQSETTKRMIADNKMEADHVTMNSSTNGTNPIARLIHSRAEEKNKKNSELAELFREVKRNLNPNSVLAYMEKHHGFLPGKYAVLEHSDGTSRIQCGNRQLNIADFLTKEAHLPWKHAADILTGLYAEQVQYKVTESNRTRFWSEYAEYHTEASTKEQDNGGSTKKRGEQLVSSAWQDYRKGREAIRNDASVDRKSKQPQLSILQTEHLARLESIHAESLPSKTGKPKPLLEKYIEECNRSEIDTSVPQMQLQGQTQLRANQVISLFKNLKPSIGPLGVVDYCQNGKAMISDYGKKIVVWQATDDILEAGLRLAVLKYGTSVNVMGSDDFKNKLAHVAATRQLRLSFKDPALESIRVKNLEKLRKGFDIER
jgi:hypothetical protein